LSQAYGIEQIHLHLSKGRIVEIDEKKPVFYFSESDSEVALVYGSVKSPYSSDIFDAPFLIPPDLDEVYNLVCLTELN